MKPAFLNSAGCLALALALLTVPGMVRAQDAQASPTPMDEKARQRAVREAQKAAEQEEKALRQAAEKERKEAENAAKNREKTTARLIAMEAKGQGAGPSPQAPQTPALTKDQERIQKAEEKARAEAEKARKKAEDRARAQEAKDAERRRKDEERAEREANKAREKQEKERLRALANASSERPPEERPQSQNEAGQAAPVPSAAPLLGKDEEKRRKELVKQIEKARDARDQLNQAAEEAERIAVARRATANEAQRSYEALTTGFDIEDVSLPPQPPAEDTQPKKSRFVTKADLQEAAAEKEAPPAAPDPLRVALDLKSPDAGVREKAAFALASLGPDAQPATRALMAALADANPTVRVAAAQALGRIGPGAVAALAPLSAALTDPDPAVKNAAQAALLAIRAR